MRRVLVAVFVLTTLGAIMAPAASAQEEPQATGTGTGLDMTSLLEFYPNMMTDIKSIINHCDRCVIQDFFPLGGEDTGIYMYWPAGSLDRAGTFEVPDKYMLGYSPGEDGIVPFSQGTHYNVRWGIIDTNPDDYYNLLTIPPTNDQLGQPPYGNRACEPCNIDSFTYALPAASRLAYGENVWTLDVSDNMEVMVWVNDMLWLVQGTGGIASPPAELIWWTDPAS